MRYRRLRVRTVIGQIRNRGQQLEAAVRKAGLSLSHWYYLERKHPRLRLLREKAQIYCEQMRVATVVDSLFNQAVNGNVQAALAYLKNKAGWKDKVEYSGRVGGSGSQFVIIREVKVGDSGEKGRLPGSVSIIREEISGSDRGDRDRKDDVDAG